MAARTSGYIVVKIIVEPDEGQFEAYCPDLEVSSFGDTRDEAVSNVNDAILLHLNALTDHGEVWDELSRRNVTIRSDRPQQITLNVEVRPGAYVTSFTAPITSRTLLAI